MAAEELGFVEKGQDPREAIGGKREADDITLLSRELCAPCMRGFCRHCYKKPLLLEWEEQGKAADTCDREIRIVPCVERDDGELGEKLRVRRADKNAEWVRGMAPGPKRIRFQPPLGHVTTGQMAQWTHGRWCDEVRKNAQDEQAEDVTVLGCLSLLVEFLLMGYKGALVRAAVRKVRGAELRWMANE